MALLALCFLLLSGCAAKRDHYDVPMVPLPDRYPKAPQVADVTNAAKDVVATLASPSCSPCSTPSRAAPEPSFALSGVLAEWWRLLGSSELDALMDRALANNPDLRIAAWRIAQSRARLEVTGAPRLPEISLPVQASNVGPVGGVGTGSAGVPLHGRRTYQASLRGDWRPDIWGELSAQVESAELQLWRATFQRDDVQRTVVASVAVAYVEYLSLNDRLRVARETEKALSGMLASVEARLEKGDATVIEKEQQKAAVYAVRATIPVLAQQREVVLNRLTSLAGATPGVLKLSDAGLDSVNFPSVLPGVPSALLLRRPDVRVVESRLLSADADIDVARARVLPPLDLTAQVGYGSAYLSQLFQPHALFWNAIANLSITIFDNGKRSKEVDFAQAVHEELVETYVRVIYDAVREVDDSLSAIRLMGGRLDAQRIATDSSRRAWDFSQESYMAGAVDYLVVLDTERTYHRNLDEWYNARMERYRGLVGLFSALGGGVSQGIVLPGDGTRPSSLSAEIDYGVVLTATTPQPKMESGAPQSQPESLAAGVDVTAQAPELSALNKELNNGQALSERVDVMLTASLPSRSQTDGIDWSGNQLREPGDYWLVEMSGLHERAAIGAAWRDLRSRFPQQMEKRSLLPRQQGGVDDAGEERASLFRLFIARFHGNQQAEELCAVLRAGQLRCRIVPAQSLTGKDNFTVTSAPQGDTDSQPREKGRGRQS